jgi:hypothetical protein
VNDRAPAIPTVDGATPVAGRWRRLSVAVALGTLLGILSLVGDSVSDEGPTIIVNGLANATSPWVLVAFAAGVVQRRPGVGAIGGALALVIAVVAYYVAFRFVWGDRLADVRITAVVWLAAAALAGSVMGAAGGALSRPDPRLRAVALAVMCGALLAESAYLLVRLEVWNGIDPSRTYLVVALIDVVVAALIPLVVGDRGYRAATYLGAIALAAAGYVAIELVFRLAVSGVSLLAPSPL